MFEILRLLGFVAMTAAWLVLNHYPPWSSFYNDACMGLSLTLLSASVVTRRGIAIPGIAWVVTALCAVPWMQWSFGLLSYSGDAFISTLYLLALTVAISAGYQSSREKRGELVTGLAAAFLAAAILSSFIAMMQALEVWWLGIWMGDIATGGRSSANLLQSNNLATLICWGALGLLHLFEKRHLSTTFCGVLLGVLLVGMALTQSRTSLAYGPAITLVVFFLRKRGVPLKTGVATLAAITVAGWVLILAMPSLLDSLLLTSVQTVSERRVGSIRFQVWPILAHALSHRPFTGYGWLQVGAAELSSADLFPPTGELWLQAHNFFFEQMLWAGYPLGIAIGLALIYWCVSRTMRIRTTDAAFCILAIIVLAVHSMLEFPYQYAYFLIPAGLCAGIVEGRTGTVVQPSSAWKLSLPVATFALFVAICWNYPAMEDDFRLVRFESLHIGSVHADAPAPDAPLMSSLTSFLAFVRTVPRVGLSAEELDAMRAQVDRYPYAASMYRYAVSLALNGRIDEARQMFIKARHIHGEASYKRLKQNLHDAVLEATSSQPALASLERVLP